VLKDSPSNARALETLVAIDLHDGKKDVAVERIKKQIELAPKEDDLRLLQTKVLRQIGRPKEAEDALRAALIEMPKAVRLCAALSRMQAARKANDEALRTLEACEKAVPEALAITAELAVLNERLGNKKAALPYYERVIRFTADDPLLLNNTAMLLADELNDGVRAVPLAEHAHRLLPNRPDITDTYAWALFKRGAKPDLEQARTLLEAIPLSKTNPTVRYHLGMVLLTLDPPLGKQTLKEALALPGEFPEKDAATQALAGK